MHQSKWKRRERAEARRPFNPDRKLKANVLKNDDYKPACTVDVLIGHDGKLKYQVMKIENDKALIDRR
jgi:hypothetical protein